MTKARALIERLGQKRIQIKLADGKLRILAPKGSVDAALKAELGSLRDAIIRVLQAETRSPGNAPGSVPFSKAPRDGDLPLSYAQQRLWFMNVLDPNSPAYVISIASRMKGHLKIDLLRESLNRMCDRHEAFRMHFGEKLGRPVAELQDHGAADFDVVEDLNVPEDQREEAAQRHIARYVSRPLDLANGPLIALTVIRFAPDDHVLLFRVHHIVADGWSMSILSREMMTIYKSLDTGKPNPLPPVIAHCVDHAAWEQQCVQTGAWDQHLDYWTSALAGAPASTDLPLDHPRPAQISYRGARFSTEFDAEMLGQIHSFCRSRGVTPYMLLSSLLLLLLYRHSGQEDILIGSPIANRNLTQFESMIGCTVNNVVLRGDLSGNAEFSTFLEQIKNKSLNAVQHSEPPFDLVVNKLNPDRSLNHAPVFQVLFTLMNFDFDQISPDGTTIEPLPIDAGTTRFDLALEMIEYQGVLKVSYEFSTDLFDPVSIRALNDRYVSLLKAVIADPDCRLDTLKLTSTEDAGLLMSARSDLEVAQAETTPGLIAEAAQKQDAKLAILQGADQLQYRDLRDRSDAIARSLIERGVQPGDIVAVAKERTPDLIAALLAVWKAGAAYLPVDPYHPADRLALIFEDARPVAVLTDAVVAERLPCDPAQLVVTDDLSAGTPEPDFRPRNVAGDDLAYVIYTSGSTGTPKGVEITHRNLVTFLRAMQHSPGFDEDDVLCSVTTPSFDIAGLEFWLPLISGGTVVMADRAQVLSGEALGALIRDHAVTVLQATPATWRMMIDDGWVGASKLKALCGGEAMPRSLADALLPRVGSLWNMYGPTETTIWSTVNRVRHGDQAAYIGQPIANTKLFVRDKAGHPAPPGVVGELCIAGEGVARGYRNREALTADRFTQMDLPDGEVLRYYRTGDLVRRTHDDRLMYIGRNDFQVKIRGFRVELGEIETRLSELPEVAQCVVSATEDPSGEPSLVAYVVPVDGQPFSETAARSHLRMAMPEYMVPRYFIALDRLPLTPNNKVDRKQLPAPQHLPVSAVDAQDHDAVVMNPIEKRVADIWKAILQVDAVGLNSSFFDVGGHSLLLVRLHEALKSEFGDRISVIELFQKTTIAQQAERMGQKHSGHGQLAVTRAKSRAERLQHG